MGHLSPEKRALFSLLKKVGAQAPIAPPRFRGPCVKGHKNHSEETRMYWFVFTSWLHPCSVRVWYHWRCLVVPRWLLTHTWASTNLRLEVYLGCVQTGCPALVPGTCFGSQFEHDAFKWNWAQCPRTGTTSRGSTQQRHCAQHVLRTILNIGHQCRALSLNEPLVFKTKYIKHSSPKAIHSVTWNYEKEHNCIYNQKVQ
jgi:hypothetical protein